MISSMYLIFQPLSMVTPTNLEPWIIPARLKTSYFSVSVKDVLFSLVAGWILDVTEF